MDNNGFGNNQNNQQQFGNNMNNQYGQQQYGNNTNNQNIQQQFNNNMNNQYGQQQFGNNMNNQQQYGNNTKNQYGNMPYNNTNNMNNKNNSNIILMIVGAFLVIVAGVALFVFFGNTKTLTCTGSDNSYNITTNAKVVAKFRRGKLNKAKITVEYQAPSSYTSSDLQEFRDNVADSVKNNDLMKNPKVSIKNKSIVIETEVNIEELTDDDTYDGTSKELTRLGFTCK